jgi:choline-sulfatase
MNTHRHASNVLLLLSDEQDARVLGCAGHPWVHTPHLDALAARGTRFTNAFTPSPICVPARASLATGRWVHQDGRYWDNALGYDGEVRGWCHHLKDSGHRVESIGKLHYQNGERDTGFTRQQRGMHLAGGIGQVWGSVRDPLPDTPRESHLFDKLGAGASPYNLFDMACAQDAAAWLAERAETPDEKPWVLFVGFVATHFPLVVPQRFLDAIDIDSLPLPALHPDRGYRRHPWVQRHADFSDADGELGTDARRRLALASYYALGSFLDEQIGTVLQALDASGLAGSTRVVFSSDHGDNQGARGMWNKSTLYREATNVPLIVSGPGVPQRHVCTTNTNLVDIAPTVLASTAQPIPQDLPGRNLVELATEPDDDQRIGFSEYHAVGSPSAAYMLRQGRWAYHHYVGFAPELFDITSDPDQHHDLAGNAAHAASVQRLAGLLHERLDPVGVDRQAKADQNALVARFGGREQALRTGAPGATPVPKS